MCYAQHMEAEARSPGRQKGSSVRGTDANSKSALLANVKYSGTTIREEVAQSMRRRHLWTAKGPRSPRSSSKTFSEQRKLHGLNPFEWRTEPV